LRHFKILLSLVCSPILLNAQQEMYVTLAKVKNEKRIEIHIGHSLFTRFIYPDSLEKPVLFPIYDAAGVPVTRGFPMDPRPGEPTDHPHHLGLWLTYENVNGLDFWNNSYAIPLEKKSQYGWIKTDSILELTSGNIGVLRYHAKWVNQQNHALMEENTRFEFSGRDNQERMIDRITELTADTDILFADAKDGMLGMRLTRELQIPSGQDRQFTDINGNTSIVKKDIYSNGDYLTSEGKRGDSAWSSRGRWCKVFGKINNDSVSVTIFDHPDNPNYPTFWHARGYGLFAANPLGEKIFTIGKTTLNLKMKKGEKIIFRYRILIQNGRSTSTIGYLNQLSDSFGKIKRGTGSTYHD
jgi:Methane oxygenase PmoA